MLSMFPAFRRPLPLGRHETATSLLARHAAQLGLHGAAIICQDLGVRWADVVSGDVRLVTDLAKAAHVSSDDLVRWSPVQTPEGVRIGHETIPKSMMSLQPRRFCPLCLKDDLSGARGRPDLAVFGRGPWHIPFLPLCETHHVVLVEPAPGSAEDAKPDFTQWIRPVLPDLERWVHEAVPCPPSDCDAYLFARLMGNAPSLSLLDGLSLPIIARACEELGRDLVPVREDVLTTDDVPTLQTARHHGFRMLAAGPGELSAYFDQRLDKVGSENLSGSSLNTLYGNLYQWVSKQTDPDLDPIRDRITDHAFTNLPLAAGTTICCRTLQKRRRHTIRSAAADFRSTQLMMRTWLVAEEILAGPASQLVENTMIPDTPEAAAFLDKAADAFTHRQVLLRLKINSDQMDDLIADGLIRPLFPSITDTTQNAYARTELAALVERLFKGPAISLTPDAPDIAYSRVTQVATLAHCAFHDVIRLLLAKPKIRGFRRRGEPGIRALHVSVEDVETAIHRAKLPGLTPWRFAQNLEITRRDLEQLMTLGLIWTKPVPHPALENPVPIIPNVCIRAFERRYISLQAFADRRGRHWIGQRKLLNANGINPVYDGPSPRSRFYEQAAVRHMMRW